MIYSSLFVLLSSMIYVTNGLKCIQCDRSTSFYEDPEIQKRQIELCRTASFEPTECQNKTHTHCVVDSFRTGNGLERVVTARRCGVLDDVKGCVLYNTKTEGSRKIRHLISSDGKSSAPRRTQSAFVEVCSQSCDDGRCVNGGYSSILSLLILLIPIFIHRLQ